MNKMKMKIPWRILIKEKVSCGRALSFAHDYFHLLMMGSRLYLIQFLISLLLTFTYTFMFNDINGVKKIM